MSLKNIWRYSSIRTKYISMQQDRYLDSVAAGGSNSCIVFLVPGFDRVNGGIMSIISLAEESGKLHQYHSSQVFVCTIPGDPALSKFTKFKNSIQVVDLNMLLSRLPGDDRILLHVPELFTERFCEILQPLREQYPGFRWHFNILLQNIDLIPDRSFVKYLGRHGTTTCTTAHAAYSNAETEKLIGCPVHHFSVWISPEKYTRKSFTEKSTLIVVSPDKHPRRKEVLDALKREMHEYEFRTIKNMTYEEYKSVISSAKFSLTFGEGLDGYFIEPVFSGGIGCAVYNDRFFTEDLRETPFVYHSWDSLLSELPGDVRAADTIEMYSKTQACQFGTIAALYSNETYISNLIRFYEAWR